MGSISCCKIYNNIVNKDEIGFSIVLKLFYIIVALSIITKCDLEILPATGLIISILSFAFYSSRLVSNKFFTKKTYLKYERSDYFMLCISIFCIWISIFLRGYPTKIFTAPAIILFFIILKETYASKLMNKLFNKRLGNDNTIAVVAPL
jgi:ABC-type multidrug transport system permease subunit